MKNAYDLFLRAETYLECHLAFTPDEKLTEVELKLQEIGAKKSPCLLVVWAVFQEKFLTLDEGFDLLKWMLKNYTEIQNFDNYGI